MAFGYTVAMAAATQHNILIFDSGVGGLSINDEILAQLPDVVVTYVADNRIYPYGTLSEQALIERIIHLFPRLIERFQPEAIVIACNSASTLVLGHLREQTATPVIGVVPAIKPAAAITQSRHIALLATPGTVRRAYTDRLIQDFASFCRVDRIGSNELVHQAENKLRGLPVDQDEIARILAPVREQSNLDTLVLGCTHFPFLRQEIAAILGEKVTLIDSGKAIAKRTEFILQTLIKPTVPSPGQHPSKNRENHQACFIFTKDNPEAQRLIPMLARHGFHRIEFIDH